MGSLTTLLIVSSIVVGQTEPPAAMPTDIVQQIDKHLIGDIVFQGKYGDQTVSGVESWKWATGKSCLLVEGVFVINGQKLPYASLLGWESSTKALVATGYVANGDTATTRWTEFSPEAWKGRISGVAEGQKYEAPAKLEFLKDSSLRYEDTTAGKPWMTVGKRVAPEDADKSFKAYSELAVGGTWVATVDGQQFEDKYESILGGKFMLLTSTGSGEFPAAVSIVGVDPISKKCTFWGFSASGEAWIGTNRLVSDGVWLGESKGSGPNSGGTQVSRLTKVDADTVKFEILEQTVSGDAKPFPQTSIWKRKR